MTRFVVGLPKNMNNTIGPRAEVSLAYSKAIEERFDLPVDYQDERLTTVQAERILVEQANTSSAKRKRKCIDKLAAVMIFAELFRWCLENNCFSLQKRGKICQNIRMITIMITTTTCPLNNYG